MRVVASGLDQVPAVTVPRLNTQASPSPVTGGGDDAAGLVAGARVDGLGEADDDVVDRDWLAVGVDVRVAGLEPEPVLAVPVEVHDRAAGAGS